MADLSNVKFAIVDASDVVLGDYIYGFTVGLWVIDLAEKLDSAPEEFYEWLEENGDLEPDEIIECGYIIQGSEDSLRERLLAAGATEDEDLAAKFN